jgi:uroporphyrinogen-III synthase
MSTLRARRVVVTAPEGSRLGAKLRAQDAVVIECPTIAIDDPEDWKPLDNAHEDLITGGFDWVLFTSRNAIERFFVRWEGIGELPTLSSLAKVGAVGRATADLLIQRGVQVDLVPQHFTGANLASSLGPGPGRVLAVRAEGAPRRSIEVLEANGWTVDDVAAYRTVTAAPGADAVALVRSGEFDAITFTSGSTATNLVTLVGPADELQLGPQQGVHVVACIGPETAETARSSGFRVDVIAEPHTNDGLVQALMVRLGDH